MKDSAHRAVAIVGLSAILPDAPDVEHFWDNLKQGRYSIKDVDPARWDPELYYDADPSATDKTYSRIGGWVRDWQWDPIGWRLPIPPKVADAMDEAQRWAINCTRAALTDFGYPDRALDPDRTAVILGNAMAGEKHYLTALRISFPEFARELEHADSFMELPADVRDAIVAQTRARMRDLIPDITEDSMPGELANCIAGRIANLFNFHGPNYVVDAACASAMAAITAACEGLEERDYDAVITGGIDRNMGASTYVKFCKIGALSATGTRPYAAGADGFVMGEGAALFLLKRLADAERDDDHIYAVIRGVGGSSDGKGKGITAPNPVGQKLAIQRAWTNAGLSPATASYVEGHGTSTRVGDVVEVESLSDVFTSAGAKPGTTGLGSVKSNIGHLKGAAGAAGLLKTVLALNDKVLPPTLHCDEPNPKIDFDHTPFFANTELRDWERPAEGARRAGVSAFGFGGTNFHVVLEEHRPGALTNGGRYVSVPQSIDAAAATAATSASAKAPPRGAMVLGAAGKTELAGRLRALRADAEAGQLPSPAAPLRQDLEAEHRIAIDYGDAADLSKKIDLALRAAERDDPAFWNALTAQGIFTGSGPKQKIAFLYPGQGSQYVNMLQEFGRSDPEARAVFEQADRVMTPHLGRPISELIFVDDGDEAAMAAANESLKQTEVTQPAVLTVDIALHRMLASYGIEPDMVMGHSLGEYGALTAAGAFGLADALEAVCARGAEMTHVSVEDNGRMLAVFAPLEEIQRLLSRVDGMAVIANINSRDQAVIGGESAAVEQVVELCKAQGIQAIRLSVSHAFHTSIVAPASEPLKQVLLRLGLRPPALPTISNVTGEFYPDGPDAVDAIPELLGRQVASPVQFVKGLETLYDAGARVFVEVGAKKALKGFVESVLGDRADVVSLHTNHPKTGAIASFNQALCGLYAAGHGRTREAPVQETHRAEAVVQPAAEAAAPATAAAPPPTETAAPAAQQAALGQLFEEFMSRGRDILAGRGPLPGSATSEVVVTGAALGLPGTPRLFADDNVSRILHGEQFIDVIPYRFRQAQAGKHITRLVKTGAGGPSFETIDRTADVVKLAGRAGEFDLAAEFGVSPERVAALDSTTAMAIAVGIDALRDAGIPLVQHYKTATTGAKLPDRWRLPDALRDDTGIIFASAFPGVDAFAEQVGEYYDDRAQRERLDSLESLRSWLVHHGEEGSPVFDEVIRRISELKDQIARAEYQFDRRFLFRVLSMGHSQLAEEIGARGPNTQVNGACASTTQAVALAEDWLRQGRCRRVIIVSADNVTSDHLIEWVTSGFLASGAAATDEAVEDAATPFDRRRHGMITGMGAAALVLETGESARERGLQPICEVLGAVTANSAFHGTRLDVSHIADVMEQLVAEVERRHGLERSRIAAQTMFMSHETYTPARGGSASAEVEALRHVFGERADQVVVSNTKGFTGHAMGAGVEDVVAVKSLETGIVPPVPNFREVDPELGNLNLSTGGSYPVQYALRLGAGFGSQIAMSMMRWLPAPDGRRRNPDQLGYKYRIADQKAWSAWLRSVSGYESPDLEVASRRLRIRDEGPPKFEAAPAVAAAPRPAPAPSIEPAAVPEPAPPPSIAPAPAPEPPPAVTAAPAPADPAPASDDVEARVIALVAEKTGYPADMLDLDLDMEADLGVDTVKQAEVFAEIRGEYDIPRDENLQLRDFPTLQHVVEFVRDRRPDQPATPAATAAAPAPEPDQARAAAQSTPAPVAADAPPDDVEARVVALVAEKTGYPADMLDLDLDMEADLGVDTVKQAEVFAEIRGEYDIPRDENLQLRDFPTLQHVVAFVRDRRPDKPVAAVEVAAREPEPSADAGTGTLGDDAQIAERILAIVSEKTGYPSDMLDMSLDMEADLGIDTVKQAEIFATLREAYGIPRDANLQLKDFPTLNHALGFVKQRRPETAAAVAGDAEEAAPAEAGVASPATEPAGDLATADRVPRRVPLPILRPSLDWCADTGVELGEGARVVLMPDSGGVGEALVKRLEKLGVEVLVIDGAPTRESLEQQLREWAQQGDVTGVYWLPALDGEPGVAEMGHAEWREALRVRAKLLHSTLRALDASLKTAGRFVVAATRLGGRHGYDAGGATSPMGGAVSGLVKAYGRERAATLCKVVDFAPSRKTAALADCLIAETLRDPGAMEIGTADERRWSVGLIEQPSVDTGAGLDLNGETVFLVTGAAGSIVSAIVGDLAAASGGCFHLLDLAPAPDRDDPDIARFRTDREGLQRELFERLKSGGERVKPVMVEKELARIERAVAAADAVDAIERAGGRAFWHQVDLCNPVRVAEVVDAVRADSGPVDVLVHAAGLEISRFVSNKSAEEFDLVFDVKSDGWYALMHALGDEVPRAVIGFSSVAGRFGNAGQTDYSAANDLLCKCLSHLRSTRPGTLALAVDWTAWGEIGMASRGSIPTMIKAAGIDMLAPAAGIPVLRRELTRGCDASEIVVAERLGVLDADATPTGGLDLDRLPTATVGPMLGRVVGMGPTGGLTVETELDPASQPFLYDHQINGKVVLPGVMGIEAFAELATMLLPDWQIADVEDVSFLAPFKFYRDEPRRLRISAQFTPDGDELLARCALVGIRTLKLESEPTLTTHFTANVRLAQRPPEPVQGTRPQAPDGAAVGAEDVYRVYTHGPAYQVLDSAWGDGPGTVVGRMSADLPPNHAPSKLPLTIAPRHIELCFQTAGMAELGLEGRFGLPSRIGRVIKLKEPDATTTLYSIVRPSAGAEGYDADVVDEAGEVYLRLERYCTSELPDFASEEQIEPIRNAVGRG